MRRIKVTVNYPKKMVLPKFYSFVLRPSEASGALSWRAFEGRRAFAFWVTPTLDEEAGTESWVHQRWLRSKRRKEKSSSPVGVMSLQRTVSLTLTTFAVLIPQLSLAPSFP